MAVTIRDIARTAGVSISTVSKVLNGHDAAISDATRSRIHAAVKELDYRPNMVARGLRARSTRSIGFVLPDITNPFFPAIARGIEDCAQKRGFTVIFCDTDDDSSRERESIRDLNDKMVDGMIVTHALKMGLEGLNECRVPTVVVDRCSREEVLGVGFVFSDMRAATQVITEHLIERGCERLAFVTAHRDVAPDRFQGFIDALDSHDRVPDFDLIFEGGYDVETGERGVGKLLQSGSFDAIVCGNDLIAIGALRALRCHGLKVPEDVRVVGIDDIYIARYLEPALTTVYQPAYEMGQAAARMLIDCLVKGTPLYSQELPFELRIRQSA